MRVVTNNGVNVDNKYVLLDTYPPGSDLDRLGADTLRKILLQQRQRHAEEISAHRKVIREQEAELTSCMSDNRMLSYDIDQLLTNNPTQEDDGA